MASRNGTKQAQRESTELRSDDLKKTFFYSSFKKDKASKKEQVHPRAN